MKEDKQESGIILPAPDLGGLTWRELLWRTWNEVNEHELLTRASAVAFSAMMAAIPFLALVITIAVNLLPDLRDPSHPPGIGNLTVEQLQVMLRSVFPEDAYLIIQEQIARIQAQPPLAVLSISLVVTLWTASSLFVGVIDAINHIYEVEETRPYWKLRLTAIFMTLIQTAILFGSLIAIVAWPQIIALFGLSAKEVWMATAVKWFLVVTMILLSFAFTFHMGPASLQQRRWVTPGSLFGTLIFILATYGFRVYIQNFAHYDQAYGSLGGVMMMLLWFWITSLVLLVAAEMNHVVEYAMERRAQIRQAKEAQRAKQVTTTVEPENKTGAETDTPGGPPPDTTAEPDPSGTKVDKSETTGSGTSGQPPNTTPDP